MVNIRRCILCGKTQSEIISLHKFPKDSQLQKQWREFCNLDKHPVGIQFLCSQHFDRRDYKFEFQPGRKSILRKNAVPTIFQPVTFNISDDDGNSSKKYNALPGSKKRFCCVCGNIRIHSTTDIHLFRFPKDLASRNLWLSSLGVENYREWYRICSQHFLGGRKTEVPVRNTNFNSCSSMRNEGNTIGSNFDCMDLVSVEMNENVESAEDGITIDQNLTHTTISTISVNENIEATEDSIAVDQDLSNTTISESTPVFQHSLQLSRLQINSYQIKIKKLQDENQLLRKKILSLEAALNVAQANGFITDTQ